MAWGKRHARKGSLQKILDDRSDSKPVEETGLKPENSSLAASTLLEMESMQAFKESNPFKLLDEEEERMPKAEEEAPLSKKTGRAQKIPNHISHMLQLPNLTERIHKLTPPYQALAEELLIDPKTGQPLMI